jgi:hypothetical protein
LLRVVAAGVDQLRPLGQAAAVAQVVYSQVQLEIV